MRKQNGIILILLLLLIFFYADQAKSQGKKNNIITIGFYNVENLFDTIDDPVTDDQEFTPSGSNKWDSRKYKVKLERLAEAIFMIGSEQVADAPAIIGLAEVENKQVVQDLVSTPPLAKMGYKIIHYDSPDKRGIDVALIYRSSVFKVTGSKAIPLKIEDKPDFLTRDILQVSGTLDGQSLVVMVNHWPSRTKGEKESAPLRNAAADLCRSLFDSIQKEKPGTGVIIMGDFNDDPINESLMDHLKTIVIQDSLKKGDLFNPMWALFEDGIGSLAYKAKWNLFDQIIISASLTGKGKKRYHFYKADVLKSKMLLEQEGQYAGYPFRSYAGSNYLGGYSDHLPAFIYLVRNPK
jgi:translation initiation factor 2 beta subunit (eIF-2beta)/eIF-5